MEDTNHRAGESVDFDTISAGVIVSTLLLIFTDRSQTGDYRLVEGQPTNSSLFDESPTVDYLTLGTIIHSLSVTVLTARLCFQGCRFVLNKLHIIINYGKLFWTTFTSVFD